MELQTVADELYSLPPGAFTSSRDARATEAKKAGDRELAVAVKSLRRPTVAAWLANQLARSRPEQLDELLQLGPKLRQAQQELAGAEVRALSQERRRLISALSAEARIIAEGGRQRVSEATLEELESTLGTGLVDPAAAELLRSGRVVTALTPSALNDLGFGGGRSDAGTQSGPEEPAAGMDRVQSTSVDLDKALAAVAGAEAAVTEAVAVLARSREEHDRLFAEIGDLETRLAALRTSAEGVEHASAQAEATLTTAERDLQAARQRAALAQESVADS